MRPVWSCRRVGGAKRLSSAIAGASAGLGAARLTQPRRRLGWTAPVWSSRGSGRGKRVPFEAAEAPAGLNGSHL